MKVHYSIGELSKMKNISIQTLRYYDQIDLFKPDYVNPENNYRYYTINQFFYLDIIKYLKYIGTPLTEMKKIIHSDTETMYHFLDTQEDIIQEKIKKLQYSQLLINMRKAQLTQQLQLQKRELGTVYLSTKEERHILKVDCTNTTPHDMPDLYIRKLATVLEKAGSVIDNFYGCIYPYKEYKNSKEIYYDNLYTTIMRRIDGELPDDMHLDIIPAGNYICIAFLWDPISYDEHFNLLVSEMKKMNLTALGNVYEVSLPMTYTLSDEISFITELQIPIK